MIYEVHLNLGLRNQVFCQNLVSGLRSEYASSKSEMHPDLCATI